jgi:two-component system nitrogen regulation sensor histidine kinase GlnL
MALSTSPEGAGNLAGNLNGNLKGNLGADEKRILDALPQPVLAIGANRFVTYANFAAQEFFGVGLSILRRQHVERVMPFGSPVVGLIERCLDHRVSFNEYGIDLGAPTSGDLYGGSTSSDRIVDLHVSPSDVASGGGRDWQALVVVQPRSIAQHMDRQLTHRGAARSVSAMSAMLAHEIKNPLSGIKGAAQLLESDASPENVELTQLICDETDRIAGLVDQFEQFTETHANMEDGVNVHAVLGHVRLLASSGFGEHVKFTEDYDPSLPLVQGNKDLLTQVFLNLVKNAAEAAEGKKAEIKLVSSFRPGVRLSMPGRAKPVSLPLEFRVIDNGAGVPEDIKSHLFDPFVTTKATGTGLGLALVAKIIGDHGGTIECESQPGQTVFCVRLPIAKPRVAPPTTGSAKENSTDVLGERL